MASLENRKIEDDIVIGTVSINLQGCKQEFEICSVNEWEKLTEEEAEEIAKNALFESGVFEWWY